jgi:hypothetical protein
MPMPWAPRELDNLISDPKACRASCVFSRTRGRGELWWRCLRQLGDRRDEPRRNSGRGSILRDSRRTEAGE